MSTYSPEQWSDFFVAAAGAAGALAGLVIVAISVNVDHILAYGSLPMRAASTVVAIVLALVVSLAALIRDQSTDAYALELLAFGAVTLVAKIAAARAIIREKPPRPRNEFLFEFTTGQLQVWLIVIGAISLLAEAGGGLYWVAAGIIAIFSLSMVDTWILLIEIRRP
jgi:modulator of FtsH protease